MWKTKQINVHLDLRESWLYPLNILLLKSSGLQQAELRCTSVCICTIPCRVLLNLIWRWIRLNQVHLLCPFSLTLCKWLACSERSTIHHLVGFDLETRHTALMASIFLAINIGNLWQRKQENFQNNTHYESFSLLLGKSRRTETKHQYYKKYCRKVTTLIRWLGDGSRWY